MQDYLLSFLVVKLAEDPVRISKKGLQLWLIVNLNGENTVKL